VLRQVLPPLVTAYAIFVVMVVAARRRPVPRPRGLVRRSGRAHRWEIVRTAVGGYVTFLVIVLIFHVWLAEDRGALVSALGGGAFLLAASLVLALGSTLIGRRR
jgi:hypothetical protein